MSAFSSSWISRFYVSVSPHAAWRERTSGRTLWTSSQAVQKQAARQSVQPLPLMLSARSGEHAPGRVVDIAYSLLIVRGRKT
jgi:hypothetical protein